MSRLPGLRAEEVIAALRRAGCESIRQRGSHVYLRHPDGRFTVVPVHAGEDLGRLRRESLSIRIGGKSIAEVASFSPGAGSWVVRARGA